MIKQPNNITINFKNFLFMFDFKTITCEINKKESGKRLDQALTNLTSNLSRSQIKHLLVGGNIKKCNIQFIDPAYKVKQGELYEIIIPSESKDTKFLPQEIPIKVIFEDDDLIVIDKNAGITVHPAPGNKDGTLVNALLFHTNSKLSRVGTSNRPGIVHRIDKETSGLLVVAKNEYTHKELSQQFKDHSITRKYQAMVWGLPIKNIISGYIARHKIHRKKMSLNNSKKGKYSETSIIIKKHFNICSFIECNIKTGRTHQIRVHLNSIGNPVVGDKIYGKNKINSFNKFKKNHNKFLVLKNFNRQALHAYFLKFFHPVKKQDMEFKSNLPADFLDLLKYLSKY